MYIFRDTFLLSFEMGYSTHHHKCSEVFWRPKKDKLCVLGLLSALKIGVHHGHDWRWRCYQRWWWRIALVWYAMRIEYVGDFSRWWLRMDTQSTIMMMTDCICWGHIAHQRWGRCGLVTMDGRWDQRWGRWLIKLVGILWSSTMTIMWYDDDWLWRFHRRLWWWPFGPVADDAKRFTWLPCNVVRWNSLLILLCIAARTVCFIDGCLQYTLFARSFGVVILDWPDDCFFEVHNVLWFTPNDGRHRRYENVLMHSVSLHGPWLN